MWRGATDFSQSLMSCDYLRESKLKETSSNSSSSSRRKLTFRTYCVWSNLTPKICLYYTCSQPLWANQHAAKKSACENKLQNSPDSSPEEVWLARLSFLVWAGWVAEKVRQDQGRLIRITCVILFLTCWLSRSGHDTRWIVTYSITYIAIYIM